jgi:hypothetical protein
MDITNELILAWTQWQLGRLPDELILWGQTIRWWARIGIIVQLVGALTIIVEIIGPAKIRAYGVGLKQRVENRKSLEHLIWVLNWPKRLYQTVKNGAPKPNPKHIEERIESFTVRLYTSLTTLMMMIVVIPDPTDIAVYPVLLIIFLLAGFFLLLSILLAGAGFSFNSVVLMPIAWVLEHRFLSSILKILSLLAVLFGIHFNLLAS